MMNNLRFKHALHEQLIETINILERQHSRHIINKRVALELVMFDISLRNNNQYMNKNNKNGVVPTLIR
jgi:hypothetical protein